MATMTANDVQPTDVPLSWSRLDIEQRLGFRGARFTRVNNLLAFLVACLITVLFYAALIPIREASFAVMFLDRGPTQHATVLLSAWAYL
jgi:hypothetical protein